MKTLFYIIAIIPMTREMFGIINPKKTIERIKEVEDYIKLSKEEQEKNKEAQMKNVMRMLSSLIYFFWCFIGLLTFQWYLFIPLLTLGLIPKKNVVWVFIDAVLGFSLILFIILNAFHFKLNLLEIFLNN